MINTMVRATYTCSWEEIQKRITDDMNGEPGQWIGEWSLLREGDNGMVWLGEIKNFDAFGAFMSDPAEMEKDKSMGIDYKAYSIQPMDA
mgnify:CR=1|tara:strand:+ start:377 stop:643 length:267 start_codon:yes stop_codon:yes gene_type:complete